MTTRVNRCESPLMQEGGKKEIEKSTVKTQKGIDP